MKFLQENQTVRQRFFRANTVVRFCQSEIAVADETWITQNCENRNGRARVQRRKAVGRVPVRFFPAG